MAKSAYRRRIDVHSHFVPEQYRQDCLAHGQGNPDGAAGVPTWTEQDHLAMMDQLNISKSYLSITSPGTHLVVGDDALARRVTRHCNTVAAAFKKRCPDRIGFFASTPLPDIAGTLHEIDIVSGPDFQADGFVLKTNHHGTYLGHPAFETVMAELNKRHARIFIHPTTPCFSSGQAATPLPQYPQPMMEFFFETARAAANLFLSGTVSRYPNITYILSHCGGALPPMIRRICGASPILGLPDVMTPAEIMSKLRSQFYFDTAGWAFPEQVQSLLHYVSPDRILYGTDFPWTPLPIVTELADACEEHLDRVMPAEWDQMAFCTANAKALLGGSPGL